MLGAQDSEKCKAAARKVGCTPSRLFKEFGKRRKEAGTQRTDRRTAGVKKTIKKKKPAAKKKVLAAACS